MAVSVMTGLRQQLSVVTLIGYLLAAGVVLAITDDIAIVLLITGTMVFMEVLDALRMIPDVDERWAKGGFGLLVLGGGAIWGLSALQQSATMTQLWLPGLVVLGGGWILLDTRADVIHGRRVMPTTAFDDLDENEALDMMLRIRLVARKLRDDPQTVPELAAGCELTESQVRRVIDIAAQQDIITQADTAEKPPRYILDEQKIGMTGVGRLAAAGATGIVRRLVRPFVSQWSATNG